MTAIDMVHTLEELRNRPASELVAMWRELEAPDFEELHGEYDGAFVPPVSVRHAELRKVNGPGEWFAKAFAPTPQGDYPGQGYNVWFTLEGLRRCVRFGTEVGASPFDGRPALLLHYGAFRHHTSTTGMLNEVRRVETGLYLAITTAKVQVDPFGPVDPSTGRSAPEPFILRGPLRSWVGVDDEAAELPL